MHILENEYVAVRIDDRGAELSGLFDKQRSTELLWSGDPAVWGYHAPVLFPFVGMVNNKQYRYKGVTYNIGQHGFARQQTFTCIEETPELIRHRLLPNDETKALYPFDFDLTVTHTLSGRELTVHWKVFNPAAEETLLFSIGAHPGFMVPIKPDEKKEDCCVLFYGKDSLKYILVDLTVTAADTENVYTMPLDDGYLQIKRHLFDIDTFIFEDSQVEKVSLCGKDRRPYLTVECPDFPRFGLWTKSDEAPFVCLEPWYGRLDDKGFSGDLSEKTGIISLGPGETFEASYIIRVEEESA